MLEKSQEMIVFRFPNCHEYPEASGSGNLTRTFWIMIICLLGEQTWRHGSSSCFSIFFIMITILHLPGEHGNTWRYGDNYSDVRLNDDGRLAGFDI